ncbi:MAG: hypothetical protein ACK5Z5_03245 [Neisseriaceae bacterium]
MKNTYFKKLCIAVYLILYITLCWATVKDIPGAMSHVSLFTREAQIFGFIIGFGFILYVSTYKYTFGRKQKKQLSSKMFWIILTIGIFIIGATAVWSFRTPGAWFYVDGIKKY